MLTRFRIGRAERRPSGASLVSLPPCTEFAVRKRDTERDVQGSGSVDKVALGCGVCRSIFCDAGSVRGRCCRRSRHRQHRRHQPGWRWLTEWAFNNRDQSCPLDEKTRVQLIATMRSALKRFAEEGRLAASFYYSWRGLPWEKENQGAIFRCGGLTDAGKLALSP